MVMSQSTPTEHEIDVYAGEFVLTGDKSKSWRKTFPKSQAKQDVIWTNAQKVHKLPQVLARIEEMQEEQREKDGEEFDLSASQLKEALAKVIGAGLEEDDTGKYKGLAAVTSAVAEFNRMNGNHAPAKSELTGKDGGPIQVSKIEFVGVSKKN